MHGVEQGRFATDSQESLVLSGKAVGLTVLVHP